MKSLSSNWRLFAVFLRVTLLLSLSALQWFNLASLPEVGAAPNLDSTPQLILTKSIEGGITNTNVGDVIRYRIRWECSSLTIACGQMEITDVLQNGLEYLAPPQSSVPSGFDIAYNGGTRTITITKTDNNLLDGTQYDAVIAVRVSNDLRPLPTTINNTIAGRIDPPGPLGWLSAAPANAPPISVAGVSPSWNLSKVRVAPVIEPTPDTDVTYRLQLCPVPPPSGGIADLTDIVITDNIPAGALFVAATDGGVYDPISHTVTWPTVPGSLAPPDCITRFITLNYPSPTFSIGDTLGNSADVSADYVDSDGDPCPDCFGDPVTEDPDVFIPIEDVPTYSKNDAGDPVGMTGTARFILELNTNLTNYPANDVVLIDNLPPQLQVTSVTSGTWSADFDYVRAYVEYSNDGGDSWNYFPGQPIAFDANDTYLAPVNNITNVRWTFEYDQDGDGTYTPGLPYVWSFASNPEIRATPRAADTLDADGDTLPAAVIGTTYNNCVQVTRTDSSGSVTDPCDIEGMTVRGNFASLQISKNETPGTPWDEYEDPDITAFASDATILPGDTLRYLLTINLTERSSAALIDPTVLDTLPADLIFVRQGNILYNGGPLPGGTSVTFTRSGPNPGAGQTLLWEFSSLNIPELELGSQTLTIEFFARIPRGQGPGTRTNDLFVDTDSLDVVCENGSERDNGCETDDTYVVERSAALRGEKWIRSIAPLNNEVIDKDTFLPDATCPNGGTDGLTNIPTNPFTRFPCISQAYPEGAFAPNQHVPPAPAPATSELSYFEYQLRIFNDGNVDMLNYVLYDILPYYGDKGSGGTLASSDRNSEFRPVLLGPVEFLGGGTLTEADFTIQYSLSTNPCRPEVFNQPSSATNVPAGCSAVWYAEGAISDWSTVRSYRILLNSGSLIQPYIEGDPTNIVRFGARMNIIADAPTLGTLNNDDAQSREIAWNSFSHVGSYETGLVTEPIRDLLASEPRKVGITIPEMFSLGNRVWRDSDNSGTINAPDDTNPGIENVLVNLYADSNGDGIPDGSAIATTTTDASGFYLFSNLPAGNYVVGIPASNFDNVGDPLYGLRSSTGTPANATYTTPTDPNPDIADHGIDSPAVPPAPSTEVFSPSIPLSSLAEQTSEANLPENIEANRDEYGPHMRGFNGERDANSDLTVDFGFFGGSDVPFSIGNHLWFDNGAGGGTINNGLRDGTEPPVAGARVELYRDGNLDGILAADELIRFDTTDAGGFYLFDNLDPGTYYVRVPAVNFQSGGVLAGWYSSQNVGDEIIGVTDQDDNGIDATYPENTGVRSGAIVLERGVNEPLGESHLSGEANPADGTEDDFNPTGWDGPDSRGRFGEPDENSNLTIDFGFIPPMSLGNRVWIDNGAGEATFRAGYNNGIQDGTEAGVAGVRVELYRDDGDNALDAGDTLLSFTTTDASGYYLFDRLPPGNYFVHLPNTNFDATGDPLFRYISSFDRTAPADNGIDINDNGVDVTTPATSGVTSSLINMNYNTEPPAESDLGATYGPDGRGQFGQLDENSDLTIDFGFVQPARSIGNHLWYDEGAGGGTPNDRIRQANEPPVVGARVSLYRDDNNNGAPDGPAIAYDITDANGFYLFDNLPPGRYLVGVDNTNFQAGGPLEGYASSVGTTTNNDQRDNGIDRVLPYDATASPYGILSANIDVRVTTNSPTGETHLSSDTGTALGFNPTVDDGTLSRGRYGEADNQSNLRIDFGFLRPMSLGNRVFYDNGAGASFDNGIMDADENGVAGVQVQLWRESNGTPGLQTTGATPDVRVTYDGASFYSDVTDASGYYLFDRLVPGNYYVYLPSANFSGAGILRGWYNSTPTFDDDIDRNDNGINNAHPNVNGIASGLIVLAWDGEPSGETELSGATTNPGTPTNDDFSPTSWDGPESRGRWGETDDNSNLTVDFGFIPPLSLGNRVWLDNGDTATGLDLTQFNDGLMNGTESGRTGVILNLFYDANDDNDYLDTVDGVNEALPYRTTTTDAFGHYLFDGLPEGRFYVQVAPANFASGGALEGYRSSDGVFDDETGDLNDNGIDDAAYLVNGIQSRNFVLNYGAEPTLETDISADTATFGPLGIGRFGETDPNSNLTLDFGFVALRSLGNRVWLDNGEGGGTANNGLQDGTEVGLDGVTVSLYPDTNGDGTPDGPAILTTTTSDGGYYLFSNFPAGQYVVGIDASNFQPGNPLEMLVSSLDVAAPVDADPDQDDHGIDSNNPPVTGIYSPSIDLRSPSNEPTGETDLSGRPQDGPDSRGTLGEADNESDLTVDFGFTYLYSLGNRVWFDTDNSGDINGTEVGADGVTVQLYAADGSGNPTGAALATATTADGGYYLFDNLYPDDYVVVIPASNFGAGAVLEGYWSSDSSMDGVGVISETAAPDPDGSPADVDSDDNGQLNLFGSLPGAVASRAVTLGPTGLSELTGESDVNGLAPGVDNQGLQPDGRANMAVDFGFYRIEIGNLVYFDANRDGTYDVLDGDTAMDGANVRLYAADNLFEIPVGPDGILGTSDDAAGGVTTSGGGLYLFSGLPEGDYVIRATPASTGVTSTTDAFDQADNDDPDVNTDDNDNGDGTAPGQVASAVLTMDAAESATNISVDDPTGTTTDLTVDFGFVEMVALGNRVWLDTGAGVGGVADDGIQNGTEPGVEDVRVELYTSMGTFVDFTTTDVNGDYYFDLLYPGAYYVFIPAAEFQSGGDLDGYVSSTGNGPVDDDDDQDLDENGIDEANLPANGIRTPVYTLEPNTEPLGDNDAGYTGLLDDDNVNLTADFGFLQFVAIGNRVWLDTGAGPFYNNGVLDVGETPVDGVTVELYTSAGALVATTTTTGGGYYEFDMLLPGQYYVQIPASMFDAVAPSPLAGYVSSLGNGLAGNDDDNNADENGIDVATLATTGIRTPDYDLQPNTEPTLEDQSNYTGSLDDNNVNFTADFAFTRLVAIGNRVWFDTGAGGGTADDGIQSGGELGVNGVRVELYTSGGVFVDFDTTDANGDYYFDLLNPGAYYVSIPANQFDDAGDALYGYVSSTGNGGVNDDDDQNLDENGIDEVNLSANGIRTPNYTLAPDTEPSVTDNDTGYTGYLDDDNVNLTADFGFLQKVAIGNIVWLDNGAGGGTANNGQLDGGEAGIEFVSVQLYDSANNLVASTVTDANGYYVFDNLLPGSYYLIIPATEFQAGGDLENLLSSSGNGADEITNETGDENGIDSATPATTGITSTVFDLQPDSEQMGEPQPNYTGALDDDNVNFTADFGFTELVALGNRVWLDTGAGAFYNNGILDVGETPVDDVTVNLYTSAGVLVDTTITSGGGYYQFDMLLPGQYYVQIPATEFQLGGDLEGYVSSLGNGLAGDDDDNDADENGIDVATLATTGIRTPDYDLQPNSELITEDQANYTGTLDDDNVNFTADFAFTRLVALGNRVWLDTGAGGGTADDGIQNGSEAGVEDVTVELYRSGDTPGVDAPVATDVTDANGDYYFDLLNPGDYFVHIPAAEFQSGGDLEGYISSTGNGTSELLDQDVDENGIDESALATNGIRTPDYTLAPETEPSAADNDAGYTGYLDDDNVNLTADFGFLQFVAIGNRVWLDTGVGAFYNNGILDVGETPVDGVTVELYTATGVLVETTTTSGGGYYEFDMLLSGQYYVQIPASMFDATAPSPLEGYVSTTVTGADEVSDNDADENGINVATLTTTGIRTQVYDLQPNTETITDDQANYTGVLDDDNVNFTADFSFVRLVAIGNRVWLDAGLLGGTPNNGRQDGGEQGIGGVDIQLFRVGQNPATDTPVATDTTDANGNYEFDLLNPGDYFVHIPASEFQAGGPLEGLFSSVGNGADETSDQDADENGIDSATMAVDGISSTPYTLTVGGETTTDDETTYTGYLDNANVNFTADFGFLQLVAIGNIVWEDSGAGGGIANNGILDGTEPGIPGVDLHLYQVGDVPGTDIPVDTTTTGAGGYYFFDNLLPGDYFIFIPAAEFQGTATLAGYTSSTGNGASELLDQDVDENGIDNAAPWTDGITSTVYSLQPNGEPTGEPQPNYTGGLGDNDVNFTADFGFYNNPQVDLGVTKDDGTTYYLAGGTLTYTVTVVNNGPIDVTGLAVSDTRPTQITSWNWACTSSAPNPAPATYDCTADATNPSPFTDNLDLPVGASVTYTVTANVDAAATGTLTNTASVTPPSGVVDNNPSNDDDDDVDQPASLDITKDDGLTVVAPGSVITYNIEVTNNGAVDLTSLTVEDVLPSDLTYQSANPAPTSVAGNTLIWTPLSLLAGASTTITVTAQVNAEPLAANLINTVTVTDANTGLTDTADDVDIVAANNGKSIIATNEPSTVAPQTAIGEIITYQIRLDVPAGATFSNLRALDVLDSGLAFVRCIRIDAGALTTTLPGGFPDACNAPLNPVVLAEPVGDPGLVNQGRRVQFDLGSVTNPDAMMATLIVEYEAVLLNVPGNEDGVSGLNNNVTWAWDGGSLNSSAPPLEVVEPDMSIEKDATPSVAPYGSTITFTLDIAHTVESTTDAFDVVVTDILPPGLAFVPGTVTTTGLAPDVIDYSGTTLTFVWNVFPLGETAVLSFQATFVGPAPVTNTADLAWTSLPIDPGLDGEPVQQSDYNDYSTERWYDPPAASGVNNYGVSSSTTITIPELPATGFAPGRVSVLPSQPAEKSYNAMDNMWLEIPDLGVVLPIVGVPLSGEGWDLTWLSNQAGYLNGTTLPGDVGTTGLTAHVTLADGTPGPFHNLKRLYWGNKVILHVDGYRYTFEVRENRSVLPRDLSVFKKDGYTWLTLLTCEGYVPWLDTYNYRLAVRAVLLKVEPDSAASPFPAPTRPVNPRGDRDR